MSAPRPVLGVGVLGAGTVGSQVIRILQSSREDFAARSGAEMEVRRVLVRNVDAPRDSPIDRELLTTDPAEAIDGMDLVVELIGGIEPARTFVLRALTQGISVVTGNKALLAAHGPELYEAAASNDADLYYEAAVAGAVPVVYGLRESLAGDRVTTVMGIVNGTTNFILDAMSSKGLSYADALKQAQDLGFAEADPTADVEGLDAAAKCSILASLAFHTRVGIDDVAVEGISNITKEDMEEAARVGHTIKLLAIAERRIGEDGREGVAMRVHPAQVPSDHPLASVDGAFNAILVEGENAGRLMFYGQGAGGAPTPRPSCPTSWPRRITAPSEGTPLANPSMPTCRSSIPDHPHALPDPPAGRGPSRRALRRRRYFRPPTGVSIQSVHQRNDEVPGACVIVVTSHQAREADLRAVARALAVSDAVREVTSTIRVEGE